MPIPADTMSANNESDAISADRRPDSADTRRVRAVYEAGAPRTLSEMPAERDAI